MSWLWALLPGLLAAALTMLLTPIAMRLAWRLQAVDVPTGRRRHAKVTPRLGGVAIVGGIGISLASCLWLLGVPSTPGQPHELAWFGLAVLIVFALGVADDIHPIGPLSKLLVQIAAASIVVSMGWQFTTLRVPWEGTLSVAPVAPILSVLWIVGVTNAINFIDGLDGLAAGIVGIIASSLLIFALFQNNPQTVITASAMVGACAGFLRHNWRPAQIFMGDSGSLTLGFILAAISLRSGFKASAALAILVPLLALGLPIIDTFLVVWYRFLKGHRRMNRLARMLRADRKHLHHVLHDAHEERPAVVPILYGLAFGFCVMALLVAASRNVWLGMGFLVVEFAVVLLIRKAGLNAIAQRLADDRLSQFDEIAEDASAPLVVGSELRPPLAAETKPEKLLQ